MFRFRGWTKVICAAALLGTFAAARAADTIVVDTPMAPPAWALAERELLRAGANGVDAFFHRYFDERGYLQCVERWGGNDGPDDATENLNTWTLLYALGADESVQRYYKRAWEGHIQQYTEARIPEIEMVKEGMYWREYPTAFDWEHNGEGLAAFHFYGLGKPDDPVYRKRMTRFAGFYTGEDLYADNYDAKKKIIRSLHNGSRGSKITHATEMDWGGLPVESDPGRLERYSTAGNIRGDHPLNLCAATLGMNAYMLTHEEKYKKWLLEYVSAWRDRILENGGNIPTNIGLDGKIGGEWDGKWYGGTFGWNFWPQSSSRNYYIRGPRIALGEAIMLTGDLDFAEPLRQQINNLYAVKKVEDGRILLPNKHGDDGWYGYIANQRFDVQRDLYLWSMDSKDKERIKDDPWIAYLDGRNGDYPLEALQRDLETVRRKVKGLHDDPSSPDERGSDSSQRYNPAVTNTLVNLMLGGNSPGNAGNVLHSRVRYFDAVERRAGLPEDVGALVSKITAEGITVTLVNTNPIEARSVVVQAGAYAEHHFGDVTVAGNRVSVDGREFSVKLEPGTGATMTVGIRRFAHQPTMAFPWNR
jgi:hypothetical protein